MKLLNRHFFSLTQDAIAFTSFIPIYFLSLILFSVFSVELPSRAPYEFFLLGWLLVDGSHVYSTLLVSYCDPEISRQLKRVLILVPLIIIALAFVSTYLGYKDLFLHILAYLAVIHFVRQEFGWMKLAAGFDQDSPGWLRKLDVFSSYAMTILPMLWFVRESNRGFWYQENDLFLVTDAIGKGALALYFPVLFLFLAGNGWHIYRTKTVNASKFLVALNTFFGWYMAKVYVQNFYLAIWLLIFHHGLPYYFLVFKTERVTRSRWPSKFSAFRIPVIYLGCVALFGFIYYCHSLNPTILGLKQIPLYRSVIFSLAIFPQMTHFVLDGYIWKKKYGLFTQGKGVFAPHLSSKN